MTDVNDPIRVFQSKLTKVSDRAEELRPYIKACQDAIERSDVKCSISVGGKNPLEPKVEIMCIISSLNETIPLFRELAKEGLKTDKDHAYQDHNVLNIFGMREYDLGPHVSVIATILSREGASCRMEQVGTKEVPVYEMKCD